MCRGGRDIGEVLQEEFSSLEVKYCWYCVCGEVVSLMTFVVRCFAISCDFLWYLRVKCEELPGLDSGYGPIRAAIFSVGKSLYLLVTLWQDLHILWESIHFGNCEMLVFKDWMVPNLLKVTNRKRCNIEEQTAIRYLQIPWKILWYFQLWFN